MTKNKHLTVAFLKRLKVPQVLIPGLIIASLLGWTGWQQFKKADSYYAIRQLFPTQTSVKEVVDGDTVVVANGITVRLLGIDAPGRGDPGYQASTRYLSDLVLHKKIMLEYDIYQDDKFGRILAYVWIPCVKTMILYCHSNRMLVNEVMVKQHYALHVVYSKRKRLKYEDLLR